MSFANKKPKWAGLVIRPNRRCSKLIRWRIRTMFHKDFWVAVHKWQSVPQKIYYMANHFISDCPKKRNFQCCFIQRTNWKILSDHKWSANRSSRNTALVHHVQTKVTTKVSWPPTTQCIKRLNAQNFVFHPTLVKKKFPMNNIKWATDSQHFWLI